MSQAFYFIHFFKLLQFVWIGKGKYSFHGPFLKSQYLRKTMKREYRHLWIIHEMICVMNNKTNINFYWVKHFFSFLNKSTYFLILGKVVFIIHRNSIDTAFFCEADTKNIDMSRHYWVSRQIECCWVILQNKSVTKLNINWLFG